MTLVFSVRDRYYKLKNIQWFETKSNILDSSTCSKKILHALIIKSGYGNFFQTLLLKSLLIHKMLLKYIIQLYLLLFCWLHIPELGCMIILFISGQYLVLRVSLTDCRYTFEPHHGRICDTAKESRLWSLKFSVKYCLQHEHLLRNSCLVTFIQ